MQEAHILSFLPFDILKLSGSLTVTSISSITPNVNCGRDDQDRCLVQLKVKSGRGTQGRKPLSSGQRQTCQNCRDIWSPQVAAKMAGWNCWILYLLPELPWNSGGSFLCRWRHLETHSAGCSWDKWNTDLSLYLCSYIMIYREDHTTENQLFKILDYGIKK